MRADLRGDSTLGFAVPIRIRYRHNPREVKRDLSRFFSMSLTLLAMLTVALLSALLAMRFAIHAGEVEVPNLAGLTLDEASRLASKGKLNLTVENRFYSTTVPAGRVLSQSPEPGESVRRGWHMRITESIGPQRVSIPDTVGMNSRDAAPRWTWAPSRACPHLDRRRRCWRRRRRPTPRAWTSRR